MNLFIIIIPVVSQLFAFWWLAMSGVSLGNSLVWSWAVGVGAVYCCCDGARLPQKSWSHVTISAVFFWIGTNRLMWQNSFQETPHAWEVRPTAIDRLSSQTISIACLLAGLLIFLLHKPEKDASSSLSPNSSAADE